MTETRGRTQRRPLAGKRIDFGQGPPPAPRLSLSSCPGLTRASTETPRTKTWMAGASPAMTLLGGSFPVCPRQPGFAAGAGEGAHTADIGGPFGDADHAARVE